MEPPEPFSPPPSRSRRQGVATRILSAQIAALGAVVATAIALILYFATRG